MRIHFIAIGGSAMHNLAIALHKRGDHVTGSDDEIFEPSRSRLDKYGLLPAKEGWNPSMIDHSLDVIILGMHARKDNPELIEAQRKGLKIYSYPEFLYEAVKDKKRVVIGGSHGKTSTTSIIMHVLKYHKLAFDYMVGANIEGFETMVGLSNDAPIAIFEGDEYLSSPIDLRPKFHHYRPHIALLTGIAWDHINVFPTWDGYIDQFQIFADMIEPDGSLIYYNGDKELLKIGSSVSDKTRVLPYNSAPSKIIDGKTFLTVGSDLIPLHIFGDHNLQNIAGALLVCRELGLSDNQFYEAIETFTGSARRLQIVAQNDETVVFFDFAHSPSKLKATTSAVKEQFTDRKLVACMELHTFSSLKKEFLPHYNQAMAAADYAYVYFDPQVVAHKKLEPITSEMVAKGFGTDNVEVFTDSDLLFEKLRHFSLKKTNVLMMSSGNFSGKDVKSFGEDLIKQ